MVGDWALRRRRERTRWRRDRTRGRPRNGNGQGGAAHRALAVLRLVPIDLVYNIIGLGGGDGRGRGSPHRRTGDLLVGADRAGSERLCVALPPGRSSPDQSDSGLCGHVLLVVWGWAGGARGMESSAGKVGGGSGDGSLGHGIAVDRRPGIASLRGDGAVDLRMVLEDGHSCPLPAPRRSELSPPNACHLPGRGGPLHGNARGVAKAGNSGAGRDVVLRRDEDNDLVGRRNSGGWFHHHVVVVGADDGLDRRLAKRSNSCQDIDSLGGGADDGAGDLRRQQVAVGDLRRLLHLAPAFPGINGHRG